MHYRRLGLTAFVTFLATILSVDLGLPVFNRNFSQNSQVLAQTPDARKVEALKQETQGRLLAEAQAEQERQRAEQEHQRAEQERQQRELTQQQLAEMEAMLDRYREHFGELPE